MALAYLGKVAFSYLFYDDAVPSFHQVVSFVYSYGTSGAPKCCVLIDFFHGASFRYSHSERSYFLYLGSVFLVSDLYHVPCSFVFPPTPAALPGSHN